MSRSREGLLYIFSFKGFFADTNFMSMSESYVSLQQVTNIISLLEYLSLTGNTSQNFVTKCTASTGN